MFLIFFNGLLLHVYYLLFINAFLCIIIANASRQRKMISYLLFELFLNILFIHYLHYYYYVLFQYFIFLIIWFIICASLVSITLYRMYLLVLLIIWNCILSFVMRLIHCSCWRLTNMIYYFHLFFNLMKKMKVWV